MGNWLDTEDIDFEGGEFDPVIATLEKSKRTASARDWNISHQYADVFYAGTNTRPERIELERNLKRMINEGRFSYKFMEGYLISLGYQRDEIVRSFKHLTGIHPYDLLNPGKFLATPPTIPGISMGWGQAKDAKYDYYFINPYNWGFAMFGQKGDTQRDVVDMFITSDQAVEGLKDHVKEAMLFDAPLTPDRMKEFKDAGPSLSTMDTNNPNILLQASVADAQRMLQEKYGVTWDGQNVDELRVYLEQESMLPPQEVAQVLKMVQGADEPDMKPMPLGEQASAIYRHLASTRNTPHEIAIMINGAVEMNHITAAEADLIRTALTPGEASPTETPPGDSKEKATETGLSEKLMEAETDIKKQPFEDQRKQVTPSEYFESEQKVVDIDKAATENVAKVLEYVKQKNSVLRNFMLRVSSFKYHGRELSERIENEIQVPGQDIEQFFAANALLSVIVDVVDNTLPDEMNAKSALLVFVIADGDVVFDDTFKGDDEKIYALTEEGCAKYFYRERQQSHETALGEL